MWLAGQPPLDSTRTGAKSKGNPEVQGPGTLPCLPLSRGGTPSHPDTPGRNGLEHRAGSQEAISREAATTRASAAPLWTRGSLRRGRGGTSPRGLLRQRPLGEDTDLGEQSQRQGRRQEPSQCKQDSLQQRRGRQPSQNRGSARTAHTLGGIWACYLERVGQLPETGGAGAGGAGREESGSGRPSQEVP